MDSMEQTDQQLLAAFGERHDETAFAELFRRHAPMVVGVCQQVLLDAHLAQDAASAVFLVLAKRARCLAADARPLGPWLHHVAVDVARNVRRGEVRRVAREQAAADFTVATDATVADLLPLMHAEIERLPEKYRTAIVLHHLQGLSYEQAAAALRVQAKAFSVRLSRGRELLANRLRAAGGSWSTADGLSAVLAIAPVQLSAECMATTLHQAMALASGKTVSGNAVVIMKGYLKMIFVKQVKMVTLATCLSVGVVSTGVLVAETVKRPVAPAPAALSVPTVARPAAPPPPAAAEGVDLVMVRGLNLCEPDGMSRKGNGHALVMLGGGRLPVTPATLRFRPVPFRELVAALAAAGKLQVTWSHDGRCAVLYAGVADATVESCRLDLASANKTVRWEAAKHAGGLADARVVPLLVKAAKGADPEMARLALGGLRQATWVAVVAVEPAAADLLEMEMKSPDQAVRINAVAALGRVGGTKALALLKDVLADPQPVVRMQAVFALGCMGGNQALALLEQALVDPNLRGYVVGALTDMGDEKALALVATQLAVPDVAARKSAAYWCGRMSSESAIPVLTVALRDPNADVRFSAADGLGRSGAGDERTLVSLQTMLTGSDLRLRRLAVYALRRIGGEKALAYLETALADPDADVRRTAAEALGNIGGEKALILLKKVLADPDDKVGRTAAEAVRNAGIGIDGEQ